MKLDEVHTYEELERYLRNFTNFSGDVAPYDFTGAIGLLLAIIENLSENSLDADIEILAEDRPLLTEKQQAFLQNFLQ